MKTITIKHIFSGRHSHSNTEQWEPLPNIHCPACGNQAVWHETGPGDYYVDEQYLCKDCGATFYMPCGIRLIIAHDNTDSDAQRLRAIRE